MVQQRSEHEFGITRRFLSGSGTAERQGVMAPTAPPSAARPRARLFLLAATLLAIFVAAPAARAQESRPLIDVEFYRIHADLDLLGQSIEALVEVRFLPREPTNLVVFDLHNGLNVNAVVSEDGADIPIDRIRQDSTVRLTFPEELPPNQPVTVTFQYEGQLIGTENSPVEGVSLASIESNRAYLLYPARWFPVNGYAADRFAAEISITVPADYKVIASGIGTREDIEGRVKHTFTFSQPSFPGSLAVVAEDPIRADSEGISTQVYFNTASTELAQIYGESVGEMVSYFSELFGSPYTTTLAVVETGKFAPTAYSAPGIVFLSPFGIGEELNRTLLGAEVAHQWWRVMVSPGNRNHSWLDLGLAKYASLMEIETNEGETEFADLLADVQVDALTYDEIPLLQAGRLPDFSNEFYALAGSKGAMIFHMLRWKIGDEAFFKTLGQFMTEKAWQSATTDDLVAVAEAVTGESLRPFFIQWTENTGTPEFSQEYTIFRRGGGKGFRIMGKVTQDMDTFSMPVELKVETEGEPEFQIVDVQGRSSDYIIDTFGKPKRVILDPNNRILRYDKDTHVKVAIRKGEQLVELGYYNEALSAYQRALDINRFSSLAHYRIGEVFFLQNNIQSAANEFRESLNGDQEPAWTEVWARLSLGKIFDISGQRERAVNEYQLAVRTSDNTQGALEEARQYLEKPYRRPRRQERIY